ncbi:DUF2927 domain-containing protein [Falsirhodobacter sp. 20TX0035]|uniref:DUF2927 domain-containing protein n=1 Tax=Falsirhodobacter sp. 20TX0035 TaxID=3022019 RepID=UPI0023305B92|nr:DUF2927 domain-containing protein [Falsirhodobacter sp. 20TX0035]MDB6455075.1 DUF2927 domain-containing protein [Falsirhodobacter sp. 20TX0035]
MHVRAQSIGLLCLLLAACAEPPVPVPVVPAEPVHPRARPAGLVPPTPSGASVALGQYYAGVQKSLLAQGLLRTDGGGADVPWNDRILAETFLRIAFRDEYRRGADGFTAGETVTTLRRWQKPVRVGLIFGPSVPADDRALERARIGSYLARLQKLTGHPIALADQGVNFNIFIVNEDERRAMGPVIAQAAPNLSPTEVAAVQNLPKETYCLVYATADKTGAYSSAFALIRQEHPGLLGLACLHEEIAQALGLQNDSPQARPSIFNDDEEFALLTDMDQQMLGMLYDARLFPGMTEEQARPLVQVMAAERVGGGA